ncbi:hypothetical protein [Nitrospira sp. Nam74]
MWDDELTNVLTTTPHRLGHHWFRTPVIVALRSATVDETKGALYGYAVATKGEAKGHNMLLDDEFLDALVVAGNLKEAGIKSRFDHPNASSTSMGSFLGRSRNFRRDGDVVRADLHLSEVAKHSPQGNLHAYTLKMAREEPEMFGASIVFSGTAIYQKDDEGKEMYDAPRLARLERFLAADVVDDPAANPAGMFSAGPHESLAEKITEFLDRYFARKGFVGFTRRDLDMTEPKNPPQDEPKQPTPPTPDPDEIRRTAMLAERSRISEIHEAMQPGQEALAQSMIEAGTSPDEARKRFLSDLRTRRSEKLATLQNAAPASAGGGAPEPVKEDLSHLPAQERYQKEWERDPKLRQEFGELSTYSAFRAAEEAGQVRLYKQPA